MKMMILDDVAMNIRLLEQTLRPLGEVVSVQEPDVALDALRTAYIQREPFDMLFLDIMMPRVSGLDLLVVVARMAKTYPDCKPTRVVMVTAQAERNSIVQALRRGADGYILKPFDPLRVHAEVRRLVPAAPADAPAEDSAEMPGQAA